MRFRIGKKVYDPHAENDSRWINLPVKAFNGVCERIKKMQLKEGDHVIFSRYGGTDLKHEGVEYTIMNLIGRLDEDSWEDKDTKETRKMMVIILDDIEYASGGGKSKENQAAAGQQNAAPQNTAPQNTAPQNAASTPATGAEASGNFTGYEAFGGGSFFDEN